MHQHAARILCNRLRRMEERCRALEMDKEAILASNDKVSSGNTSVLSLPAIPNCLSIQQSPGLFLSMRITNVITGDLECEGGAQQGDGANDELPGGKRPPARCGMLRVCACASFRCISRSIGCMYKCLLVTCTFFNCLVIASCWCSESKFTL